MNSEKSASGRFLDEYGDAIGFIGIALLVFAVLQLVYFQLFLQSPAFFAYLTFLAKLSAGLLQLIGEQVTLIEQTLLAPSGATVTVAEGCDALRIFSVLVAAIVAFEATVGQKLNGLVFCIGVMFILNILRISGLLWVDIYYPERFDLWHETLLPIALWAAAMGCFFIWGSRVVATATADD